MYAFLRGVPKGLSHRAGVARWGTLARRQHKKVIGFSYNPAYGNPR